MIFVYLSGKDINPEKIPSLNKALKDAKDDPGNPALSPTDQIFFIINTNSIPYEGKEVVCMEIRSSPHEPREKISAIERIVEEKLLLSQKTELVVMPII
jgi:hypothetical protein